MKSHYHHGSLPVALLAGAEAILEREGIAALTLRAAAREAGVSHTAPAHHFGDLSGLLTALAAAGFLRLREYIEAEIVSGGDGVNERLRSMGRGYVGFAQACPALFQLMFRSERLDWSNPELAGAGASAFDLLNLHEAKDAMPLALEGVQALASMTARWSLMHGLSMLLIDGRLGAMSTKVPGADLQTLIGHVLDQLTP